VKTIDIEFHIFNIVKRQAEKKRVSSRKLIDSPSNNFISTNLLIIAIVKIAFPTDRN
jgi:hypothetical protein